MNKILTTSISDPTIGQPLTGKSLEFLQNANKESIAGVCESIIGSGYSDSVYYIISGLNAYGTNQYTAGYVYYNGELFYSAGKVSVTAFSNVPVLTLTVTNDATADPLTFTDNVSRNVHNVRRMVLSDAVSGTGTVDLSDCTNIQTFALKTKIINIGDWNMDSTDSVSVTHGLSDHTKVRAISVMILPDIGSPDDGDLFNLESTSAGPSIGLTNGWIIGVDATNVSMYRLISGGFDNTSFDATSFNRGYITIDYVI